VATSRGKPPAHIRNTWDWIRTDNALANLSGNAYKLFNVMLTFRSHTTGEAYPSIQTLAAVSGLNHKTVSRLITELLDQNCIRYRRSTPNRYRFNPAITGAINPGRYEGEVW
jgi:DNA-binding transcriptional MocR family regulator